MVQTGEEAVQWHNPVPKASNGACLYRRTTLHLNLLLLIAQLAILPALYFYFNIDSFSPVGGMMELVTHQPLQDAEFPPRKAGKAPKRPITIPADGNFNGFDVHYRDPSAPSFVPLQSTVHCMGENFGARSWLHRSCSFRNLCFDLEKREFTLFRPDTERDLMASIEQVSNRQV